MQHHPPLERADLPGFFEALNADGAGRPTEIAIRSLPTYFLALSSLGPASWGEFDLASGGVAHTREPNEDGAPRTLSHCQPRRWRCCANCMHFYRRSAMAVS